MEKLSVIMLSKNRAHIIGKSLASLRFADEIVVVDDYSTDNTVAICREFGCRVFENKFVDFEQQTNFALSKAKNKWVFWLDADQVVSKELQAGIKSALKSPGDFDAFDARCETIFLGKLTSHGGETNYLVRLFKKSKTRFDGKIHEHAIVKGKIGRIQGTLFHIPYRDINELFEKASVYSSMEASVMFENGKSFNALNLFIAPTASFCWRYFFRLGILDGYRGLIIAIAAALYRFSMHAKLWELENKKDG